MPQIILDTSVVVPRLDERDALRQPAMNLWTALEQQSWSVIFFDCVANETISVLCRRFTERQRLDMWPEAFARFREFCRLHPPSWSSPHIPGMFTIILDLIGQHQGHLNFHDALLALQTRELGIPYIARLAEGRGIELRDFGFGIANLEVRSQESGVRIARV